MSTKAVILPHLSTVFCTMLLHTCCISTEGEVGFALPFTPSVVNEGINPAAFVNCSFAQCSCTHAVCRRKVKMYLHCSSAVVNQDIDPAPLATCFVHNASSHTPGVSRNESSVALLITHATTVPLCPGWQLNALWRHDYSVRKNVRKSVGAISCLHYISRSQAMWQQSGFFS